MKQKKWIFLSMLFLCSLLFSVMSWPMEIGPFNHPPLYVPRCPSVLSGPYPRKLVDFRLVKELQRREELLRRRRIQTEQKHFVTIIWALKNGGHWEDVPEKYRDVVRRYAVQHDDWAIIDAIIHAVSP